MNKDIKKRRFKSGDWGDHGTGPLRPNHLSVRVLFRCYRTLKAKWAGFPLCIHHCSNLSLKFVGNINGKIFVKKLKSGVTINLFDKMASPKIW